MKSDMNPMDQEILQHLKDDFLLLTKQYSHLGELLAVIGTFTVNKRQAKLVGGFLAQYHEMGEQLKIIGSGLDALGGESVMYGPGFKPGRIPSEN